MEQTALPLDLREIALTEISANPQVRKIFDPEKLQELAESIKDVGVVQPIVVVPAASGEGFKIVAGERRFRAAQLAGKGNIPAVVRSDLNTDDVAVIQLIENVQRENLAPMETAAGCAALVERLGLSDAARRLGKSKSWVTMRANILAMPQEVQALVRERKVQDVQILHDIVQLKEVSKGEFNRTVEEFSQKNHWVKPPTRDQLHDRLKQARETKARKDADKEKKKAAAKKGGKKGVSENQLRAERAAKIAALREDCARFSKEMTTLALGLCAGDFSKVKERYDLPVYVDAGRYRSEHDNSAIPASAEAEECTVRFQGSPTVIGKALNAVVPGATLSVSLDKITQTQALAIEKALGRKVRFTTAIGLRGRKVKDALELANGISHEKPAKAAVKKAKPMAEGPANANTVQSFIAACTSRKAGVELKAADFRASYEAWCKKSKLEPLAANDNRYGNAIRDAGIDKKRFTEGYRYIGLQLLIGESV